MPLFRIPTTTPIQKTISALFVSLLLLCGVVAVSSTANAQERNGSASWTPLANLPPGGSVINLLLLSDGTVMAQSGDDGWHWFKLTPDAPGSYVNGTWTTTAPMSFPRIYFSTNILQDGRVWLLGGEYTGRTSTPISRPQAKFTTRSKTLGRPSHLIRMRSAVAAAAT